MRNKLYGFPDLPRAGLGNMLYIWADCFIWCKDLGVEQIAPFWWKLRIGPYMRGERDKRQYQRLFINSKLISGIKRSILLLIANKVNVDTYRKSDNYNTKFPITIVCFSDMSHFDKLIGRHEEVLNELYRITRPEYWPIGLPQSFIGIHIRMGDFPIKSDLEKQHNFRIPLQWYLGVISELRSALGANFPVIVFSDGTDEEIKEVLELENVNRSPFSQSITDLLAIAKSTVIITSRSSYSLFGAYLGHVPSIWYEGKNEIYQQSYMPEEDNAALEVEWMYGQSLSNELVNSLKKRI
jgi:hypothetical protein